MDLTRDLTRDTYTLHLNHFKSGECSICSFKCLWGSNISVKLEK